MSNEKNPGCLGMISQPIIYIYMYIYKDPYLNNQDDSLESKTVFFSWLKW